MNSISIPESVTKIESEAFRNCTKLDTVTFGKNVKEIGSNSFEGCSVLKEIAFFENLRTIGDYAFANCVSLTSVDLGTGVQTMGCAVFMNDVKLTEIVVPASLKNCNGTGWISLYPDTDYSNSYSNVGTFGGSYIKTATFAEGATNAPAYIFSQAKYLRTVDCKDSIAVINNYAFFGCNSLSSINIPLNVIKIGDYAFSNCSRLGELTLSSALKELSSTAFIGSSAILNIPDEDSQTALTLIDQEIVYTTDNPGIKDREDKNLNMQKSTYLPAYNSVTSSGVVNLSVKYSFKNTVRLLVSDVQIKIRIPSSVTYIDNTAKVNGAIASTVLQDNFLIISLENKSEGNITFSVRPNDSKF